MRDNDQDIPLLDMQAGEPPSSPLVHRRRPKTKSKLTPCRFCLGLFALVVSAAVSIFLWQIGSLLLVGLAEVRNPHLAHQHPRNQSMEDVGESKLVRSFYGEAKEGGVVEQFDLIASIYHRVRVGENSGLLATVEIEGGNGKLEVVADEDEEKRDGLKEEVRKEEETPVWGPWERIFSEVVLEGLSLKSKGVKTVAKVVLPGRILPSLRNSTHNVNLWGSFSIVPSSLNTPGHLIPIAYSHSYVRSASTRETAFPSPWPVVGNTLKAQRLLNETRTWKQQLGRESANVNLLRAVVPRVETKENPDAFLVDGVLGVKADVDLPPLLVSRSMVTMARETGVYSLDAFRKRLETLGEAQRFCDLLYSGKVVSYKSTGPVPDCAKTLKFAGRGPFMSLYEMGTEEDARVLKELEESKKELALEGGGDVGRVEDERTKGEKGWRYGPYIQTNFGIPGTADFLELGNGTNDDPETETDFPFDWHLTFSTSSPLKIALATGISEGINGASIVSNRTAHGIADGHDKAELFNALLGHPFNSSSRPLLSKALRLLSNTLSFFSYMAQAYFWVTRSVTTGISMPIQVIDSVYQFFHFAWDNARKGVDGGFWFFTVAMLICSSVLWSLALRLEFTWWGWVPVRVSRRKATHLERASARLDMRFTWKQRAVAFLGFLALSVLLPKLPYLISASPPPPPTLPRGSILHDDETWYLPYIRFFGRAAGLTVSLSQLVLNHRARTFGADYRFVAAIDLVSSIFHALPVLMSSRWGRWELMDPWAMWDLLEIAKRSAFAWQAWRLPEVKQEEEEDE